VATPCPLQFPTNYPSEERIQFLTEKMAHYAYIFQKNAYVIGPESRRQDVQPIYNEAVAEFNANPANPSPPTMPKQGDLNGEAEWFALCDEICQMQPTRLHDFYTISMAAYAGMRYILERAVEPMSDELFALIMNGFNAIAFKRCKDEGITNQTPSSQRWSRAPRNPNGGNVVGPHLIGQKIRYEDELTGDVAELTVRGCDQTPGRAPRYNVEYSDGEREKLSTKSLGRLLIHRIP
ncbi:hypothetical protein B0H21DRAFT_756548, partial [Amylocystis lapponica]